MTLVKNYRKNTMMDMTQGIKRLFVARIVNGNRLVDIFQPRRLARERIGSVLTEKNEMRDVGIGIINAILSTLILAMIALIAYMLTV